VFDSAQGTYEFRASSSDGALSYVYSTRGNGSLNALTCSAAGGAAFHPSFYGGFLVMANGIGVAPWSAGVSWTLLSATTNADTLTVRWRMSANGATFTYSYTMHIAGRTLVLRAAAESPLAMQFTLDRSEETPSPVIVPVPYLTLMNVLYSNGVFVSAYGDWERTQASRIYPSDAVFSATSVYYAQFMTFDSLSDGSRNTPDETFFITGSPRVEDVFPSLENPVSPYRALSASRTVVDLWRGSFADYLTDFHTCRSAGVDSAWMIAHVWQRAGYDCQLPDIFPASVSMGGDAGLRALSDSLRAHGWLFALHENYVDLYPDAPSYADSLTAIDVDGTRVKGWYNQSTGIQAYVLKPSRAGRYFNQFGQQIHAAYATNASYLDVHSAANPSNYSDHAAADTARSRFTAVLNAYRALGPQARAIHAGPVSGEGNCHYLYAGWYDDFEAQIDAGHGLPALLGVRMPVFPDFKLRRLHALAAVHGVGYYERFFPDALGAPHFVAQPLDTALIYLATEIAYGNSGFVPNNDRVTSLSAVASLEARLVRPAQLLYGTSTLSSIAYDDNGAEVSASEFIRRHPATFADIASDDFMSRLRVSYANGTVVCVNRHPSRSWTVTAGAAGWWYDCHATVASRDSLFAGVRQQAQWALPPRSGWVVCAPQAAAAVRASSGASQPLVMTVLRDPSRPSVTIRVSGLGSGALLRILDLAGRIVSVKRVSASELAHGVVWRVSESPSGVYVVRLATARDVLTREIVLGR
jgi:hypothetical protein